MPRPSTKKDLIALSNANYSKLKGLVDSLSENELNGTFPEKYLNRNVRDVLAHLHHWHLLMLGWYETGMKGEKPDIPAKGYNWRTLPELNREIKDHYSNTKLEEVLKMLESSFQDIQKIINRHSNNELFERKRYQWTRNNALGSYLVSSTSSHYEWAIKLIKKYLKSLKEQAT